MCLHELDLLIGGKKLESLKEREKIGEKKIDLKLKLDKKNNIYLNYFTQVSSQVHIGAVFLPEDVISDIFTCQPIQTPKLQWWTGGSDTDILDFDISALKLNNK